MFCCSKLLDLNAIAHYKAMKSDGDQRSNVYKHLKCSIIMP